jgi:hypothetical protein
MLFVSIQYIIGVSPLQKVASVRFPVKETTSISDAIVLANSLFDLSYASVKEVSIVAPQDVQQDRSPPEGAFLSCVIPTFLEDLGSFSITIPYPKQNKNSQDILTILSSNSSLLGQFLTPYFKIS